MWITNMTHFPLASDSAAVNRAADYFGEIVAAATALNKDAAVFTALRCRRRPKRRPCSGHIKVILQKPHELVCWSCSDCGESGEIRGWANSPWTFSWVEKKGKGSSQHIFLTQSQYRFLRKEFEYEPEIESLLFSAEPTPQGIVLHVDDGEARLLRDEITSAMISETRTAARRRLREMDRKFSRMILQV